MTIARLGFLLVFPAVLAFPQTNIGRISGTVTDSTGAAVPDCPVEASDAKGLKLVSQIATNGRESMQLLRLSPGVVSATLNLFNPQLALNQQNVNSIRTQSSYFLVDGAENHDAGANSNGIVDPNVDAIAELKMETSSYAAEFGGRAGAVINVVTKSGTKNFHGTLFEFVRSDAFDARS